MSWRHQKGCHPVSALYSEAASLHRSWLLLVATERREMTASKGVWVLYCIYALYRHEGKSLLCSSGCWVHRCGFLKDQDLCGHHLMFHLGYLLDTSRLKCLQKRMQSFCKIFLLICFIFLQKTQVFYSKKILCRFASSLLVVKELSVYWHQELQMCY